MEEVRDIDGQKVTFRPAKAVDDRLIQEHFYQMDKSDVRARFFSTRRSFFREDMEGIAQVDYINNLSIVAVTGEVGFERVIGLGVYARAQGTVAEVAFSVVKEWQAKGIANVLLEKITAAARENGLTELMAYAKSSNTGMIKLFKKLPYQTDTIIEGDTLVLKCRLEK
jgi:RimJ/RimL family protein N-acetyltransferase